MVCAVLGVLAAFWGVAFIRVLYGSEDLADRIWHGPEWLRPGVGGALLGLLLILLPQMYGDVRDQTVVGWIAERDILVIYRQRLTQAETTDSP